MTHFKMRLLGLAGALLLLVGGLAACGQDQAASSGTKVKIGVDYGSLAYLQIIASKQGYFSANGLDATLTEYSSGVDTLNGVVLDQVDIGSAYDYGAIALLAKKSTLTMVSTVATDTADAHWFTVTAGIKTLKQLKGKTIGVMKGSNEEYLWAKELEAAGLSTKDVTFKSFTSKAETITALKQGAVQGIIGEQEYKKQINAISGAHTLNTEGDIDQQLLAMTFTTSSYAKKHPKVIKAYLKALKQAAAYIKAHPQQAAATSAAYLKLETSDVKAAMADYDYAIGMTQANYTHLQAMADWEYQTGVISSKVAVSDFIDVSALRQVSGAKVTYTGSN